MAQHFLLSAAARTQSLRTIYAEGEEAAYRRFCRLRWPDTNGKPVCPRCRFDEVYAITTRRKFKCKACHHQFSVTSGTIFASHKLAFVDLLGAMALVANAAKGMSALQVARTIDVSYKTAFVLLHKLREAIRTETDDLILSGTVEIDGAFVGGHVRPLNRSSDRIDRRLRRNRRADRRSVIALRQRGGRMLTDVCVRESEGVAFAAARIVPGAHVVADMIAHWDLLDPLFSNDRIDHSESYSRGNGIHTNGAESYFARMRRMIRGQHHRVGPAYLKGYAAHAAWLEDYRKTSNGRLVDRLIVNGLLAPVSRAWKGYWQRAS
jgi:transposase-like protein